MENDATFVAPEGVYSLTDEQKPPAMHVPIGPIPAAHAAAHTKISSITVHFPISSGKAGQPFLGVLNREGRREKEKEKEREKDRLLPPPAQAEKEGSLSGSDNSREDATSEFDNISSSAPKATLAFSPPFQGPLSPGGLITPVSPGPSVTGGNATNGLGLGKKKPYSRPKHNMRTTSSTFVTKLQSVDGLSRLMGAKQGEVTFLFYNYGKNLFWTEAKAKVREAHRGCCSC